jgi:hypothetical protein
MAAQIGEGRRDRQSKIDFLSSALAVLRFPNSAAGQVSFPGIRFRNHDDNRRMLT